MRRPGVVALAAVLVLTGAAAAGGAEPAPTPAAEHRIQGADRYETAALVARATFPDGAPTAVIALGEDFPDALAAANLVGRVAAPVLLTRRDRIPETTRLALRDLGTEQVLLVGGSAAVDRSVEDALADCCRVTRFDGPDRYATAARTARAATNSEADGERAPHRAVLVAGHGFADALAAAPVVAKDPNLVLLLTERDRVPSTTTGTLRDLGIRDVTIVGGTASVAESVADLLRRRGLSVRRIAGPDRAATAAAVATTLGADDPVEVVIARGDAYADALAVAPYAASRDAPVLLTPTSSMLGAPTATYLAGEPDIGRITFVGGPHAVAPGVSLVAARLAGEEPRADRCASQVAAGLPLDHRLGLLLMVGAPDHAPHLALAPVQAQHVGGVILAGRYRGGISQVRAVVDRLQTVAPSGRPLLVAADQEGGLVQALQGSGFSDIPRALEQGSWDPTVLRDHARVWGDQLRRAGVDLNLAPVVDVVPADRVDSNPPIGRYDRQFGSTPETVASHGSAFTAGMQLAGVDVTPKHFPGLGRVTANTDNSAGVRDHETTADDPFLHPFQAATDAGAKYVMMSSATYSRIDPDRRAVFSPTVIREVLRARLGFDGVVMSDDLGAAAEVAEVPVGDRAVRFVAAGGDLVLTVRPADAAPMAAALLARASTDSGFQRVADVAALRVLEARAASGRITCAATP